jgi:asparagine synthase (glutamine-hydrolysing)
MCGICGIAFADPSRAVLPRTLDAMMTIMAHRGPDDHGQHLAGSVGFGHRRLSIVDLAGGHQPLSNEDGSVWIAFNGEIYNHAELRVELEAAGHRYRTHSDTETLVHLYEAEGIRAPRRLRGMFAYAIWDDPRQRLVLTRDHTGIKPLYFAPVADGGLVFGSEIKCLAASGLVDIEVDPTCIEEYFASGHVSGERTLLRGVFKLPAGATLVWEGGRWSIERYWTIPEPNATVSEPAAADEFWTRFVDSVRSQLMSDVPLGAFLSGGIDSSLLVAAMRAAGVDRIKTFSVGYSEAEASELPVARMVARALGTEHHEAIVEGSRFFDDLPELTWQRDLPLSFSASIPLYHLARLAGEHVTVVLTGEGSDELFAGYGRYPRGLLNMRWGRTLDRTLPGNLRRGLAATVRRLGSGYVGTRLARSFLANPGTFEHGYLEPFSDVASPARGALLSPDLSMARPWGDLDAMVARELLEKHPLEALLRYDTQTYLEELLMKQDAMSMAASIESRVPFLDHLLVEWATTVPASAKLRGRVGKVLVREAARAHLPRQVVDGPKRGFLVPLGRWLREQGRGSLDAYLPSAGDPFVEDAFARRLVREHADGRDRTGTLWRLLAFQVWRMDTVPRLRQAAEAGRVLLKH